MLLALLWPVAAIAYDFEVGGIYYDINGNEVTVTYKNTGMGHDAIPFYESDYSGQVDIPSTVTHDGIIYQVSHIGAFAFSNCYDLTGVTVPNTVSDIGASAFDNCI